MLVAWMAFTTNENSKQIISISERQTAMQTTIGDLKELGRDRFTSQDAERLKALLIFRIEKIEREHEIQRRNGNGQH